MVPFTTPELTQAALAEADALVRQLDVRIRVIAVQTVPIALDLDHPPIATAHLKKALGALVSSASTRGEIYLVRDPDETWANLLAARSLVVIASRRRPWRTREQKLARLLKSKGHEVLQIFPR